MRQPGCTMLEPRQHIRASHAAPFIPCGWYREKGSLYAEQGSAGNGGTLPTAPSPRSGALTPSPGQGMCQGGRWVVSGLCQALQTCTHQVLASAVWGRAGICVRESFDFRAAETGQAPLNPNLPLQQGPALLQTSAPPGLVGRGALQMLHLAVGSVGTERSPTPFLGTPGFLAGSRIISPER